MAGRITRFEAELDLYDLVHTHPAFDGFTVERVLKTGPSQVTAVAQFQGQQVVVKRFLNDAPAQGVRAAQAELDSVAARMTAPEFKVNRCVAAFPELGLIVLSFVPGMRLDAAIRAADRAERARLMTLSGGWLRAYTHTRCDSAPGFSPDWWIKKRIAAFGDSQPPQLGAMFAQVLQVLRDRAPDVRGAVITKAAVHGDFASINAHYHAGTIYGVDIQGRARLPLVQDVAKFLVWTQTHTPLEPPVAPKGMTYLHAIAAPDITAFLASGVVPDPEQTGILPFFIGLHILQAIGTFQDDPAAMAQVRAMVQRFCDGA